jgi:dehydrogenase/reductase SDR family member 7B
MNYKEFNKKTVWITGASSGIGEALAVEFAGSGSRLVLSGRDTTELGRVATKCRERSGGSEPSVEAFDIAGHDTFPRIVGRVLNRTGGIDILVNNAGVGQRATALSCRPEVIRKIFDVNFYGPVFLTREILPSMIKHGSGRIVVVSSILGKFHLPGRSAYAASKHALQGYFGTLRTELHGSGIGVTIVCPGWIATAISRNALTADGNSYEKPGMTVTHRMSAEKCARRILRTIATGKREALIGGIEIWGGLLRALLPEQYDRVIRKRGTEFVHQTDIP